MNGASSGIVFILQKYNPRGLEVRIMNNSWNKVIYKIWSPIYDRIFNSGAFLRARKKVFANTHFTNEQKILFVGVGTGADLELIEDQLDLDITAIDFSRDMLDKARAKFENSPIKFQEMDAQNMDFENNTFDVAVASLIISVVPDANKCLKEIGRVVKPGGVIIIFDKFSGETRKQSISQKLLRPIIKVLGTDIGLNFEELYSMNNDYLKIEVDTPVMMNGMYRKIILSKL